MHKRLRTVAAAESPDALSRLRKALRRHAALEVVAEVSHPSDLARAVRRENPALVYVHDTITASRWARVVDTLAPGVAVIAVGLGRVAPLPFPSHSTAYAARLAVPTGGHIEIVRVADVDYVEGAGGYVRIHTRGRVLLLREGVGAVAARLDPARFVRIHRSVVVNVARIKALRPCGRGEYDVELDIGTTLKLTRTYRDRVGTLIGSSY